MFTLTSSEAALLTTTNLLKVKFSSKGVDKIQSYKECLEKAHAGMASDAELLVILAKHHPFVRKMVLINIPLDKELWDC